MPSESTKNGCAQSAGGAAFGCAGLAPSGAGRTALAFESRVRRRLLGERLRGAARRARGPWAAGACRGRCRRRRGRRRRIVGARHRVRRRCRQLRLLSRPKVPARARPRRAAGTPGAPAAARRRCPQRLFQTAKRDAADQADARGQPQPQRQPPATQRGRRHRACDARLAACRSPPASPPSSTRDRASPRSSAWSPRARPRTGARRSPRSRAWLAARPSSAIAASSSSASWPRRRVAIAGRARQRPPADPSQRRRHVGLHRLRHRQLAGQHARADLLLRRRLPHPLAGQRLPQDHARRRRRRRADRASSPAICSGAM